MRRMPSWLRQTSRSMSATPGSGVSEFAGKSGRDLAIESHDIFTVAKLQAGYTRYFEAWKGLKPGIGAGVSAGVVPDSLKPFYGSRVNVGLAVFVTLRPAERGM
jgi:hypothetical protein